MSKTHNVAVLVGSLRKASINRKLALARLRHLGVHVIEAEHDRVGERLVAAAPEGTRVRAGLRNEYSDLESAVEADAVVVEHRRALAHRLAALDREADAALDRAKTAGRNRVQVAELEG